MSDRGTPNADASTKSPDAVLLFVVSLAAALRLWQINEPLWLDELHSAWTVAAGAGDIAERAAVGNQSPLYFYLPWITTSWFGMSELSLRLPSLVAGCSLVATVYVVALRLTGCRIAAAFSATLATCDLKFLFYSTETRPYACLQLTALWQLYCFWMLQRSSARSMQVVFCVLSVLMFYLHYTAALLFIGQALLVCSSIVISKTPDKRACSRSLLICLAVVGLSALPALPHLLDIGSRRNAWATFVTDTSLSAAVEWFRLAAYVGVPSMLSLAAWVKRPSALLVDLKKTSTLTPWLLVTVWFAVPIIVAWALTVTDSARLFHSRYLISVATAPMLVAALLIGSLRQARWRCAVAVITVGFALYQSGTWHQLQQDGRLFADRREDWRGAAVWINQPDTDNDVVFVRSGFLEADKLPESNDALLYDYCTSPVTTIYRIHRARDLIRPLTTTRGCLLTEADTQQVASAGSCWFVVQGSAATCQAVQTRAIRSLQRRGVHCAVDNEQRFGSIGVFRFVVQRLPASGQLESFRTHKK